MSSSSNATIFTMETWDSNMWVEPSQQTLTKGVILQPNSSFVAHIYFNNMRIWLGTFKSEMEAGMAYDSAALKLRDGYFDHYFPLTNRTLHEPNFQIQFPDEAVTNMIRDGSYPSRFANYVTHENPELNFVVAPYEQQQPHSDGSYPSRFANYVTHENPELNFVVAPHEQQQPHSDGSYPSRFANYVTHENPELNFVVAPHEQQQPHSVSCEQLFQKELTPSDVGRLNRLVIPKRAALKFFPPVPVGRKECHEEQVELTFHDTSMRVWKFRYCYWQSSRSYVFTRGWNQFLKVNNLRPRDVLTFWQYKYPNNSNEASLIHVIEVTHSNQDENGTIIASAVDDNVVECSNDVNEHELEGGVMDSTGVEGSNGNSLKRKEEDEDEDEPVEKKKGFRLFGVQIV